MIYIKDVNKKSKKKLYILKEFGGKIAHASHEMREHSWHELDGKKVDYWRLDHVDRQRAIKHHKSLFDYGYEEVNQFAFRASLYCSGSGSSSRYTDILEFSETELYQGKVKNIVKELFRSGESAHAVGVTVGSMHKLLEMVASNPAEFSAETRQVEVEENKFEEKLVFTGNFVFETNKSSLCIKPYEEV